MPTFVVPAPTNALVAATVETIIELTCPAGVTGKLIAMDVTFNGVTATAVPVVVDIVEYATSVAGTAFTPLDYDRAGPTTARITAKHIMTAEGATPTVLQHWYIPPTSGFSYQWPLGRELVLDVSKSYGLRCTAPAVVNVLATLVWEE